MAYCVCGSLECEHPTYQGCTSFLRVGEHEQLAAVLLSEVPIERVKAALENFGRCAKCGRPRQSIVDPTCACRAT